jgi:hypothetical protein
MSKVVPATFFAATGNADALDEREPVENEQNVDFASHLRAAFQGEPREALIPRGEAKGAAAETEQLWTTLRIVGQRERRSDLARVIDVRPREKHRWRLIASAAGPIPSSAGR